MCQAESELLLKSASGDRHAFATLYSSHLPGLERYLYLFNPSAEENEEIIQEVFLKIWERRELLVEIESFKAYVFRSSRNLFVDRVRKAKMEKRVLAQLSADMDNSCRQIDDDLCFEEYQTIAAVAIDRLTEKRRHIFQLRTQEGLSLDEIAARLKISKSVVKKQFYAASSSVLDFLRKRGEMTINFFFCAAIKYFVQAAGFFVDGIW